MKPAAEPRKRPTRYRRLQRNLVWSFVLIGVLLVGIAAWSVANDYQRRLDEAGAQTAVLVRALGGQVQALLSGSEGTLRQVARKIAESGGARTLGRQRLQAMLKAESDLVPSAPVIFVLGADGELLGNSANPALRVPKQPEAGCLVKSRDKPDGPMCIGKLMRSPVSGEWRIVTGVALTGGRGQFEGIVGMGLDPKVFETFFHSLGLGNDFTLALVRSDGIILVRYPWNISAPGTDISQGAVFSRALPRADAGTLRTTSVLDGRERTLSYLKVPRFPLVVSVSVLESEWLAPWRVDTLAKCAFVLLALVGIAGLLVVSLHQVRRLEASEADLVFNKFSTDRSAEMVLWIERDGRFYYVNNALCERTGYRKEELLARSVFELCPDLERAGWEHRVNELGKLGSRRLSQTAVTKSGERFSLDAVAGVVEYSGRSLICVNARDETAQRAADAALRESESRYRSTVDSLHEGVMVRDRERILACNPSAERIFGLPAERIVGRPALSPLVRFYGEDGALVEAGSGPAFRALRTGTPQYGNTYRIERPDGSSMWVEANAAPLFRAGENEPYRVVATYADITSRREAETALRASEERFARVFDLMPELVTVTDLESGRYVAMNEAWTPLTGFTRAEAMERTSTELDIWADRAERQRLVGDVKAHGEVRDREIAFRRKDGSIFFCNVSACSFEVQGRRLLMLIVRDVTRQKHAEEERRAAEELLRDSEERFEIAVRNADVGIWDWRIQEDRVHVSDVYRRLMGIAADEPAESRETLKARINPDDRERVLAEIWQSVLQRTALDIEYRVEPAPGAAHWVRAQGRATYGDDGRAYRYTGSLQDITERKRVEVALVESELKFREIFETSLDPIWIARVCDDGRIEYEDWNHAQIKALGRSAQAVRGKTPHELFPQWGADLILRRWRDCIEAGVPMSWEERWPLPGGNRIWFTSVVPLRDAGGRVYRLAGISRDLTDRIAAEDSIRRLNEELEHRVAERTRELEIANKELEAFSYSVSHDLRAPLRAVEGFSALLTQTLPAATDEKSSDYLRRIRSAALRMGRLIDDMLNLSRVGRHQLSRERFDLGNLAREVCEEVRNSDLTRNVSFAIEGDLRVEGDASLLRIAFTNLIGNAWKFSAPKSNARITVRGERDGQSVNIAVIDNGVGFDPAYSARLFGAFQRLHNEREFAGSGIGLAIVQRIVHRHGGEITASGIPGEGATFVVKLPLGYIVDSETQH